MASIPALFIGGAGPPADIDFAPLLDELGDERPLLPFTPIAFRSGALPSGFSLATEAGAILALMDSAGHRCAHVVGYSGGAAVGLALADAHPERVASLMLEEPAWVGNDAIPRAELEEVERLAEAMRRPPFEAVLRFRELMVQPEVLDELRPLPKDAPWLPSVVKGVLAFSRAFRAWDLDWDRLRASGIEVRLAVGSRSNPVFEQRARRAAARIPGARVDVYDGLHHLNPPHRGAPARFARSLRDFWRKAESRIAS